jgi:hypothetical protein
MSIIGTSRLHVRGDDQIAGRAGGNRGASRAGDRAVARILGVMGFMVSAAAIVLACVPADEEPNKTLAVIKVVGASVALVAIGAMIYRMGKRRS